MKFAPEIAKIQKVSGLRGEPLRWDGERQMIRALAFLAILLPSGAFACPEASNSVLFHSCWGRAEAASLLLPEEGPVPQSPAERLVITGGYTGKDLRAEKRPNPVGMFVHRGTIVNPTLARMDGVILLSPRGEVQIQHRRRVELEASQFDLTEIEARRQFQAKVAASGGTAFQSHLVVIDGELDVRPRDGAPVAVRRFLFTDGDGFGIYQTARPRTLHDATVELDAAVAPDMAVNLDMGSYDYCLATRSGVEVNCGVLARGATAKLSNLLVLSLEPRG